MSSQSLRAVTSQSGDAKQIQQEIAKLERNIATVIYGKAAVIRQVVTTLVGGGHLLLEDVPGVGKTTLAVALANSMGGSHHRIQFTSDLLPSDIIGVPIFNQKEQRFEFKPGPLFANIVLADEINRTTPKTQSCMLEAMQDGKVSVDRLVHPLPQPFMVIATQNPVEHHGTYPLPESQLDRFMMRLEIGYPQRDHERQVLKNPMEQRSAQNLQPVLSPERIGQIQKAAMQVTIDGSLIDYILNIAEATRKSSELALGISTRGTLMLQRAAQANALCDGRDYCTPDDIKKLVLPVLAHRVMVRSTFASALPHSESQHTAELILERILSRIEIPA